MRFWLSLGFGFVPSPCHDASTRRGEVGLDADEIQGFEDLGYVMSGSRHKYGYSAAARWRNQFHRLRHL
jgi:hypothetical protein